MDAAAAIDAYLTDPGSYAFDRIGVDHVDHDRVERNATRPTPETALDTELTVAELERLDLAYAPPFSPVWGPILVAAKVLNGALERDS